MDEIKKPFTQFEYLLSNLISRLILYLTDGFLIAGAGLLAPIFAIFVEKIGGSILEAGIASGIFSLTAGIGIFVISVNHLYLTQLILGIAAAIRVPSYDVMLTKQVNNIE